MRYIFTFKSTGLMREYSKKTPLPAAADSQFLHVHAFLANDHTLDRTFELVNFNTRIRMPKAG